MLHVTQGATILAQHQASSAHISDHVLAVGAERLAVKINPHFAAPRRRCSADGAAFLSGSKSIATLLHARACSCGRGPIHQAVVYEGSGTCKVRCVGCGSVRSGGGDGAARGAGCVH